MRVPLAFAGEIGDGVGMAFGYERMHDSAFPCGAGAIAVIVDCPSFAWDYHLRESVAGERERLNGESGEDEPGEDSNSPQGEFYLKFAGGGG